LYLTNRHLAIGHQFHHKENALAFIFQKPDIGLQMYYISFLFSLVFIEKQPNYIFFDGKTKIIRYFCLL